MNFRITAHSGSGAPAGALDLLWQRIRPRLGDTRFSKGSAEIRAEWDADAPVSMASSEREEVGRLAMLEIVQEVCKSSPDLELDWFAVSVRRY